MKLWKVFFTSLLLCSLPIVSRAESGCPEHAVRKYIAELVDIENALMLNLIRLIHQETLSGRMFELKLSTHNVITDKTTRKIFGRSYSVTTYTAFYSGGSDAKALEAKYKEQLAKNEIEFNIRGKPFGFKIAASQIIIQVSEDEKQPHRAVLIPSQICFWKKMHEDIII